MAVSSGRRKRLTAFIFTVCLLTALLLYKKGVREAWDGTAVGGDGKREFSKLDWFNESIARTTAVLLPTKIYSVQVIEIEGDDEDLENVGKLGDQKEGTGRDRVIGNRNNYYGVRKLDSIGVNEALGYPRKTDEPRSRDEFRKTDELPSKEEPQKVEKFLGETQNVRFESLLERRADADAEDAKNNREQSNKYTVVAGYIKSKAKPVRNPTLTTSVRSRLPVNSSTVTSNASTINPENIRVTSTQSSIELRSSRIRENHEMRNVNKNVVNVKTKKAAWVTKTTEMNNPRFKKHTQPGPSPSTERSKVPSPTNIAIPDTKEPLKCKIPSLDPFHPHVSRLQNDVGTNLRKICRSMYPYTPVFKVVGNKLVLKKNVKEARIQQTSIELREIKRESDSDFSYKRPRNPFKDLTSLRESNDIGQFDFFRLNYKIDGRRASDLYALVSPRRDLLERQTKLAEQFQNKGLPLNVLIIGFDSTSRANFVRKLPRVKSFLETELNTYFMEGMSIVGDATTPVLIAMLTGKDETVLPEGRTSYGGKPIDNWPWIMKDYESQGYMTFYAEDDPSVSAFNLRLRGFSRSPTHHYMRPFWLSLEREHERDEPGRCSKSESMVNHTLKYVKSFFDAYPTSRKFAFAFHSYLAHAHPNHLSFAEEDLMWFLKTFVDKGYDKDTMLIIMGDHGSRNAEYRDTMQGKLEERLPWFSISLPSEFHRKFPDLAANLRSNQGIITSSFDVHATLRHILTYPRLPSEEQTQSLFEKLPRRRSCEDAGIAEHWCPCFQWSPTDVNSKHARSIAVSAVKFINEKLLEGPVLDSSCHKLSLDKVIDAVTLHANNKMRTFYSTDQDGDRRINYAERTRDLLRYQIIFMTQPNNGKYEVTASVSPVGEKVTLNPQISRLNRYNNQPACIAKRYPYARKFCYCRTSS